MTAVPATSAVTGIHWPTSQATSLQNIIFRMSTAQGTQHQGLFIESGSGGFMNDLVFNGGLNGAVLGNQQFTMRNLTFNNAVTAIKQIWNWGWTYKSISINNCQTGLDVTNRDSGSQAVGSVTWLDSSFTNTKVAFSIARSTSSSPPTGGSLSLENVALNKVPTAVLYGPGNTVYLAGTTGQTTIGGWKSGNLYNPTGPTTRQASWAPPARPASLVVKGKYYEKSKPQYNNLAVTSFVSARNSGAKGDGATDDTTALQNAINSAANSGKVLFVDAGTYKVTKTIFIPNGSKIVGESYSVIMSSGSYFSNINSPQVVVQVGNAGETGVVEWSDMIVSTQGAQAGAILIRWNLASTPGSPSGMWDVHTRIGGFSGSKLQKSQCPITPSSTAINQNCIGAYMSMHITKSASILKARQARFGLSVQVWSIIRYTNINLLTREIFLWAKSKRKHLTINPTLLPLHPSTISTLLSTILTSADTIAQMAHLPRVLWHLGCALSLPRISSLWELVCTLSSTIMILIATCRAGDRIARRRFLPMIVRARHKFMRIISIPSGLSAWSRET